MGKVKCTVENERLVIDFCDESRSIFMKGRYEHGMFHVRTEYFETYPGLLPSDKMNIRQALLNSSIVID
ncbi:hypothetical protein [Prevotella denticola]|uniref:hypothetical protein n=1 Tax=Prevotella denticola TaxID=28129 RepID=UPI001BA9E517|nr:hypothetical protein [Prevotella denticola]QUB91953.1 hypothetical protein J4855_05805 [Prevotella denticola]